MHAEIPDFDVLVALHRHDPEAFETFRTHLLRQAVESAPAIHRPSLERLLTRIEAARKDAQTPKDAALVAFHMMQDSVKELHDGWEQARYAAAGLQTALLLERVRR